jgi:FSR family fosmidomycin resistance protein-like MFS transporter
MNREARKPKPEIGTAGTRQRGKPLFSFCAFHFLDDGFADSIYLLLPFIAAELHLSFSEVGVLKGVFSGAMGLFQVPMSLLGEKIGELWVIAGGTFGLTGGFLFLSAATTFPGIFSALIFAKGTGAGQHGLSSSVLSRIFEQSGRRAAMGTFNFAGDVGKVTLPFILAVLINLLGWRPAVFALSLGGISSGIVLWTLARKTRIEAPLPRRVEREVARTSRWGIQDRKGFSALLTIGIIDISTRTALLTFLPFLLLQKGFPPDRVGFALTVLFAGGAAGKFACGILAEWVGIITMVVATEALTTAGILALFVASGKAIWILLPLVGIFLNGTSSVLYATVAEIISPSGRSRGYGLYYAVTLTSGAIAPVLYGFITDFMGLSFSIVCTALMALITIPLSHYLSKPTVPTPSGV